MNEYMQAENLSYSLDPDMECEGRQAETEVNPAEAGNAAIMEDTGKEKLKTTGKRRELDPEVRLFIKNAVEDIARNEVELEEALKEFTEKYMERICGKQSKD